MAKKLIDELREFLSSSQGKEVDLDYLRRELKVDPNGPAWNSIRGTMSLLVKDKIVKPSGRKDGTYKVLKQIKPVSVYGRERRPPIEIHFPRDFESMIEMDFFYDIVFREGDLILISGVSNQGKTALCMNFAGENIESNPVLMGNEYTTIDDEPAPRFLNRLDAMDWIEWANGNGEDKFTLLPVRDDYEDWVVPHKINIIDWINIETGEHYLISKVMEGIKRNVGKGMAIIAIQKSEIAGAGRGGQFTKDFADCELLLDKLGEYEILLTVGKVKEPKNKIMGRTFAYHLQQGVKIINFREVIKCPDCFGKGWKLNHPCDNCHKTGYIDK